MNLWNLNYWNFLDCFFLSWLSMLLLLSWHLHHSLEDIIHVPKRPKVLREVCCKVMRIKGSTRDILNATECFIIKESSKAERPEVLLEELVLSEHWTREWISEEWTLSVKMASVYLGTKACKERWALEKAINEVRSCRASERIPPRLILLLLPLLLLRITRLLLLLVPSLTTLFLFFLRSSLLPYSSRLTIQVRSRSVVQIKPVVILLIVMFEDHPILLISSLLFFINFIRSHACTTRRTWSRTSLFYDLTKAFIAHIANKVLLSRDHLVVLFLT